MRMEYNAHGYDDDQGSNSVFFNAFHYAQTVQLRRENC